jgi:hypothetical protein
LITTDSRMRRHYTRFKMDVPIIMVADGATSRIMIKDVSARGVCGILERPLEVKQQVKISFDTPIVRQPFTTNARVVWARALDNNSHAVGLTINHLELDNFVQGVLQHTPVFEPAATPARVCNASHIRLASGVKDNAVSVFVERCLFLVALAAVVAAVWFFPAPVKRSAQTALVKVASVFSRKLADTTAFTLGSLDGIMYDPAGESFAVINGAVIREGQTFKNMVVKSITRDSVVFGGIGGEGEERTLVLKKK